MSSSLYDSLVEKWRDYLTQHFNVWSPQMSEEDTDDFYDELVDKFCVEHGYSEKTKNFAFYGRWYDTFKDEYYQRLEREGIMIIHEPIMVKGI